MGTREWAQFSNTGALLAWGNGNSLIGQVVRDGNSVKGYADSRGQQVITYTRNQFGEIRSIEDSSSAKVEYKYTPTGQIEEVIDTDGVRTRYEYDGAGNIKKKTIGDQADPNADPANPQGEQVSLNLTYLGNGQLRAVKDDNGEGSDFSYLYDAKTKIFTKTEKATGNIDTVTTTHVTDGLQTVSVGGSNELRVERLCEDSIIRDRSNRITYFDRDRLGRLHRIGFPDGKSVSFEHTLDYWPEKDKPWDTLGKPWGVKAFINAIGTRYDYIRDPKGNILEATETGADGKARKWKFTYDGKGNRTSYRLIIREDFQADDLEDFQGKWTYDEFGNPASYIDAKLNSWFFKYNPRGDLIEILEPPLTGQPAGKWEFDYTRKGQLKHSKDPAGFEVFYKYNSRGLLKEYREVYEAGKDAVWKYDYNRRGKVAKITDPFGAAWTFEYDGAARVTKAIDPDGHSQQWTYDTIGRVKTSTDGNGVAISYDYFDTALPGATAQPDNPFTPLRKINYPTFTEEQHFNLRNQLIAQVLKPKTGLPITHRYTYDEEGRITQIERPDGQKATFAYDKLGLLTSQTLPGWGTETIEYLKKGRETRYHHANGQETIQYFDVLGLLEREQRADGSSIRYEYDRLGNLERFFNSNGNLHSFSYKPGNRIFRNEIFNRADDAAPRTTTNFDYNLRGDLTSYTQGTTGGSYLRDKVGRVLTSTTNYGPFQKSHSQTYKSNGLPGSLTDPTGVTYQYLWDNADQFTGVVIPDEGSLTYSYNQTDWIQPQRIALPGGVTQTFQYDDLRRIKRLQSKTAGGATIQDYQYSYNPNDLIKSVLTEFGQIDYEYDSAFRLTSFEHPSLPAEEYIYDNFGNRSPADGPAWTYDENGAVETAGEVTYAYDSQGNRIRKVSPEGTTHYFYNESDQLIRVESPLGTVVASYGYDASGTRLWKEVGGEKTYFYYTPEGLAAEFDDSGLPKRSYGFSPGANWSTGPLFLKDESGYHYYHNDHLVTPQKLTNSTGAVEWNAHYAAYGDANIVNENISNPLRLPGQYLDPETGLHQNMMRDYDPKVGAYLQRDPLGLLMGPNRYGYAFGDPLHLIDPMGLNVIDDIHNTYYGQFKPWLDDRPLLDKLSVNYITTRVAVFIAEDAVTTGFNIFECGAWLFDYCMRSSSSDACETTLREAPLNIFGFAVGLGVGRAVAGAGRALGGEVGGILRNTDDILFSQRSINSEGLFSDGRRIQDMIDALRSGKLNPGEINPIRIFERDGKLYSLDNRRLFAHSQAGVPVNTRWATPDEVSSALKNRKPNPSGGQFIKIPDPGVSYR